MAVPSFRTGALNDEFGDRQGFPIVASGLRANSNPHLHISRAGFHNTRVVPVSSDNSNHLLDVKETAARLGVSTSWVRRHRSELPVVPVGRLVKFHPRLLSLKFQGTNKSGNRLKSERIVPMFRRYQSGSVIQRGKKGWRGQNQKFTSHSAFASGTYRQNAKS